MPKTYLGPAKINCLHGCEVPDGYVLTEVDPKDNTGGDPNVTPCPNRGCPIMLRTERTPLDD
jgi:hypothetical protein